MSEDVESNAAPRNFTIGKVVRVSYHQGYSQYQESKGMQCTINAYMAIIFSSVKDISFSEIWWSSFHLNDGIRISKFMGLKKPLSVDELPHDINYVRVNI